MLFISERGRICMSTDPSKVNLLKLGVNLRSYRNGSNVGSITYRESSDLGVIGLETLLKFLS